MSTSELSADLCKGSNFRQVASCAPEFALVSYALYLRSCIQTRTRCLEASQVAAASNIFFWLDRVLQDLTEPDLVKPTARSLPALPHWAARFALALQTPSLWLYSYSRVCRTSIRFSGSGKVACKLQGRPARGIDRQLLSSYPFCKLATGVVKHAFLPLMHHQIG